MLLDSGADIHAKSTSGRAVLFVTGGKDPDKKRFYCSCRAKGIGTNHPDVTGPFTAQWACAPHRSA